jgi:uncharacterized repeat protein (TIGR02543 family)
MKSVSILLITVALIVGMVGCGGGPVYSLTIDSTAGGVVTVGGMTISGKTIVKCEAGVLDLVATPATNYTFVNWTGNASTIGNVTAANTTITVRGDYSITANFAINTAIKIIQIRNRLSWQ